MAREGYITIAGTEIANNPTAISALVSRAAMSSNVARLSAVLSAAKSDPTLMKIVLDAIPGHTKVEICNMADVLRGNAPEAARVPIAIEVNF